MKMEGKRRSRKLKEDESPLMSGICKAGGLRGDVRLCSLCMLPSGVCIVSLQIP